MSTSLIHILSTNINNEEVNAVSAKELHKALELKKDFSNWIKKQIERAELTEDVNYITHALKGVGGQFEKIDYILTLDSAKHIAMMSQSKKAKEVREYFIETEKNYIVLLKKKALANTPTLSLTSSLTDELFKQNEQFLSSGIISTKLTPNEIRVLSTLIKLQEHSNQNYLVMTNKLIAQEIKMLERSVVTAIVKLEEAQAIVKLFRRNTEGRQERRLFISAKLLAALNFKPTNKNVAVPPPSVVTEPIQATPNIKELEKLIKDTINEALKPLFAQSEKTYALPSNPKAKKIKALKHAIQIGKEMMVQSPQLEKEYRLQIHNGEVQLSHLLEA